MKKYHTTALKEFIKKNIYILTVVILCDGGEHLVHCRPPPRLSSLHRLQSGEDSVDLVHDGADAAVSPFAAGLP